MWTYMIPDDYCGEYWEYPCDTREDAISLGKRDCDDDFYIGQCEIFRPKLYGDNIIDDLQEQAWSFAGEYADGWLDYPSNHPDVMSLEEKLQSVLDAWIDKTNNKPMFFNVYDIEKIENKR